MDNLMRFVICCGRSVLFVATVTDDFSGDFSRFCGAAAAVLHHNGIECSNSIA